MIPRELLKNSNIAHRLSLLVRFVKIYNIHMKSIYLDYAATTPVDPEVELAMKPFFSKVFANPSSLHSFGQEASRGVFEARRKIALAINADYKEIVFTGSATEANNLALRGVVKAATKIKNPRIIIFSIEHESLLETANDLGKTEVIVIPASRDGFADLEKLKSSLNDQTILVSVMYANNEIGTIQPIAEISKIVREFRAKGLDYPLVHTDAVQAFQYLDCDVKKMGVDLMTLSAHKIYGPKGMGALYVRRPALNAMPVCPITTGSGQEFGLRSGTENVPHIVGFEKAVEMVEKSRVKESKRVSLLRDYFWKKVKKAIPEIQLNGSEKNRLPNNLNIYFPGNDAHELQIRLDLEGIAVSPGAACASRVSKASYVLLALGFSEKRASESLRFSLGRPTTKAELDHVVTTLVKILKK